MKNILHRTLAALLALMLVLGMTFSASAAGYSSRISSIMLDFSLSNSRADSAPQQQVNGAYRMVELLEIIAQEKGCSSSSVSSIMLDYSLSNSRSKSAAQQSVNGLYRSVELLELIAKKWD